MASVRQSRGRLFLDYRSGGRRRRAYVKLADTPENQTHLQRVAKQVDATVARGGDVDALLIKLGLIDPQSGDVLVSEPEPPSRSATVRSAIAPAPMGSTRSVTPAFSSFAELWFAEFKVGWRKTYVTTVRGILDKYLIPKFGPTNVGEVSRAQILELRTELSKLKGRREGTKLSPARINTIMLIVRQILTEAGDRYEFTMPMARLRPLKIPKTDVQPFTLEQTQLLISKIRADYRDYLKVRFFTGLRSGEIHGLKWKYIDFERRLILVREAFVAGEDEYTKTDSSQRDIPMSQVVFDALKRQHDATGRFGEYVFCNRKGEPIDTNNFTKRVWYPLLRNLGLTLRRPYQTRHTAATLWLACGEAPAWIAMVLGHASSEMLFRVYSRFVPNLTRQDGSAIDRLLTKAFTAESEAREGRGHRESSEKTVRQDEGAHPPGQPPPSPVKSG